MPPEMRSVYSSQVDQIGYDSQLRELWVTFVTSGQTAVYEGVPQDVADSVMNDRVSVGRALNQLVKPAYPFHYA